MSRWTRIDGELKKQHKTWASLGQVIGASKQSMSNWRNKDVPAKFFLAIDRALGMPPGWTEDETIKNHAVPERHGTTWPFDLAGLTQERYEALPLSSRHAIQTVMREAIAKEEAEVNRSKQAGAHSQPKAA